MTPIIELIEFTENGVDYRQVGWVFAESETHIEMYAREPAALTTIVDKSLMTGRRKLGHG